MPKNGTDKDTRGPTQIIRLCFLCFALCLFVAGFSGCYLAWTSDVVIEPEFEPNPPRVGQVTIMVHVSQSGKPVTGAQAKFELNMTHAGMTPVFVDATEVEPGRYRANTQLTMAGDWSLLVTVAMPDGSKAHQSFDIKGVSSA